MNDYTDDFLAIVVLGSLNILNKYQLCTMYMSQEKCEVQIKMVSENSVNSFDSLIKEGYILEKILTFMKRISMRTVVQK